MVRGNETTKRRPTERKREKEKKINRRGYQKKKLEHCVVGALHRSTSGQTTGKGPVYPPLFGPCEEVCGHVSSRVPRDRIKRGWQKGSRRYT